MKTLRNRTQRPIRIPLPGGKTLFLGPAKTGQVADDAVDRPALRKLLDSGDVEIVGGSGQAASGPGESAPVHESTHGHTHPTVVKPSGNR
jgi:hypothetical protein